MLRGKTFVEEVITPNQITGRKLSGGDTEVKQQWCTVGTR